MRTSDLRKIEQGRVATHQMPTRPGRSRDERIRGEVIGEFRAVGACVDSGDPMTSARFDEWRVR